MIPPRSRSTRAIFQFFVVMILIFVAVVFKREVGHRIFISTDPLTLCTQASRAIALLMGYLALSSGVRHKKPWRTSIFTGLVVCYLYLIFAPIGGPGGDPHANPPNVINIIMNTLFSVLFWRVSGYGNAKD